MTFDYGSPAELFTAKRKGAPRKRLGYRRFATAAEALRFAVEDFPAIRTIGAWMQVGDERFDSNEIHRLYDSDEFSSAAPNGLSISGPGLSRQNFTRVVDRGSRATVLRPLESRTYWGIVQR